MAELRGEDAGRVDWSAGGELAGPCDACGFEGALQLSLSLAARYRYHRCPACGTLHLDDRNLPSLEGRETETPVLGQAWPFMISYFWEVGANLESTALGFADLRAGDIESLLEIGGGYGFGLDMARKLLDCRVLAVDPGVGARFGAEVLNLPLLAAPFGPGLELRERDFDRVVSVETLEHVSSPLAFLESARRLLRPGGRLTLTTPAAEVVTPEAGAAKLFATLTPPAHLRLFTAAGLARALRLAGFSALRVDRQGDSLVAVAAQEGEIEPPAPARLPRERYIEYLQERRRDFAGAERHLAFEGYSARLILPLSAAGRLDEMASVVEDLLASYAAYWGMEVHDPDALSPIYPQGLEDDQFARWPASLAIAAFGKANALWRLEERPREAERWYKLSSRAASALVASLEAYGGQDLLHEWLGWTVRSRAIQVRAGGDLRGAVESARDYARDARAANDQHAIQEAERLLANLKAGCQAAGDSRLALLLEDA